MSDPQQPQNPYLKRGQEQGPGPQQGQFPVPYPGQYSGQYPHQYPGQNPGQNPLGYGNPQDVPLHLPAYGLGLGGAVKRAFRKYVTFSGRASLSEYWWFWLFDFLVSFALFCFFMAVSFSTMDPVTEEIGIPTILVFLLWIGTTLAMFLPTLAVTVRRLHDANFSGGLLFLYLIPGLGSLVLFILLLFPSTPAGARFDGGYVTYPSYNPHGY